MSAQLCKQLSDGAQISYEQYMLDISQARLAQLQIAELFRDKVDVIIAPSATGEAPLLKEGTGDPVFVVSGLYWGYPAFISISEAGQMDCL